jgi:hypothetical protein
LASRNHVVGLRHEARPRCALLLLPGSTSAHDRGASASQQTKAWKPTETQLRSARAQARYYSFYDQPQTTDARAAAALAQERYYSSYGEPPPLTLPQSPAPSPDTPWLPIALSTAIALALAAATARQVHRRRAARVPT